jgi:hypothetical protein
MGAREDGATGTGVFKQSTPSFDYFLSRRQQVDNWVVPKRGGVAFMSRMTPQLDV